jgi:hypothetical protein
MSKIKNLAIVVFLFQLSISYGQERQASEVYSMMIFNFIKYVQWPDMDKEGEFVIGVVGNTEIYNSLNKLYGGKTKGSKTYAIKKFANASELTECQVVFIDNSKSGEFDKVNSFVKGKSTLVITDHKGLASKGSCINFKMVDEKLRFELNQQAISSSNLKVSGSLTSMAILI